MVQLQGCMLQTDRASPMFSLGLVLQMFLCMLPAVGLSTLCASHMFRQNACCLSHVARFISPCCGLMHIALEAVCFATAALGQGMVHVAYSAACCAVHRGVV
jgi:hypothetical protein